MSSQPYSIIIATKDRESYLANLLESLLRLTHKPVEIVVSSSGRDISTVIGLYKNSLNLVHIVSEVSSQIFQKKQAILNLSNKADWVVFLDDDVLVKDSTIDEAFRCYELHGDKEEIAGVGFAIENLDITRSGYPKKFYSKKLGRVLKSGHNVGYLSSVKPIYTEWLNGASMWRYSELYKYDNELESLKRALAEDLIFSYSVSKENKLIYCPSAVVRFQNPESQYVELSGNELKLYFFVMLYFVSRNRELSLFRFYTYQLLRFLGSESHRKVNLKEFTTFFGYYLPSMRIFFHKKKAQFVMKMLNS
jgi:glycosyltransferase involved in cell wall biosynthesis